jgi:3-deoxy-D-manno-octulosonic acid (KDO) 8-phosphate synthase
MPLIASKNPGERVIDGLFLEIHDNPSLALSDKYNSFDINKLRGFLSLCLRIKNVIADVDDSD